MIARRPGAWLVLGLLATLNLLLYAPALDNGFSLDDFNWLERAAFRASAADFVFQAEPGQILNPVPRALFLGLHEAAGLHPLPYRLGILGLHVLAAFLLFTFTSRLAGDRRIGLLAAALFSLHTAYDEALFWVAAFFHPLAAVFVLATLVTFLRFQDGARVHLGLACVGLFLLGCLTKASAFVVLAPAALCLLLPGVVPENRRRAAWLLAALGSIAAAVVLVNLALGAADSYLLERGYYRPGAHMLASFGHYAAWLLLPFGDTFARLGLGGLHAALFGVLRWIAPVALLGAAVAGTPPIRVAAALTAAALLPFLPFAFDPVSRYTYLAATGVAAATALLVGRTQRRSAEGWSDRRVRAGLALALVGLFLVSAADTRLRDHHYEYRERQMRGWVADVSEAVHDPPPGVTLAIVGLPRLAIDPGIHLEAALRLHYDDPDLELRVLGTAAERPGEAILLVYRDDRILPPPPGLVTPRPPGTRE